MVFPEGRYLIQVGMVSHIMEELVIIQGFQDIPPVGEGTVLWLEEKTSLSILGVACGRGFNDDCYR